MKPFDKLASNRDALNAWAESPELRREFGNDQAAFVAYREAVDRGQAGRLGAPAWASLPPIASAEGARAQAEREWDQLPAVRAEFTSKANYLAYRAAEARGAVRLRAPKAPWHRSAPSAPASASGAASPRAAQGWEAGSLQVMRELQSAAARAPAAVLPAAAPARASLPPPPAPAPAQRTPAPASGTYRAGLVPPPAQSSRWRRVFRSDCAALDLEGLLDPSVALPKRPTGPMPACEDGTRMFPWWFRHLHEAYYYDGLNDREHRLRLQTSREELAKALGVPFPSD